MAERDNHRELIYKMATTYPPAALPPTKLKVKMTSLAPATQRTYPPRSAVIGWIFFDWAAQPYFTLITTFVFAPYFATRVAPAPATGQSLWGFATSIAGFLIAFQSPVLGANADAGPAPAGRPAISAASSVSCWCWAFSPPTRRRGARCSG